MSKCNWRQLTLDVIAQLIELHARMVRIDEIGRFGQLRGRKRLVRDQDAVLHVAVGGNNDEQQKARRSDMNSRASRPTPDAVAPC